MFDLIDYAYSRIIGGNVKFRSIISSNDFLSGRELSFNKL